MALNKQVQTFVDKIIAGENAADLDSIAKFYAEDVVIMGPGSPAICGKANQRKHQEAALGKLKAFKLEANVEDVMDGGNHITARVTVVGKHQGTGLHATKNITGKALFVLTKQGSDFQIKWESYSFDEAPAPAPAQ